MDLLTLLRAAARRWYVVTPILVLTLVLAWMSQSETPPRFQATGSVVLEEPTWDPARLAGTHVTAARLVDEMATTELIDEAASGDTELRTQVPNRATIEVNARGGDPDAVEQSIDEVIDWVQERVPQLQDQVDIPDDEKIQATVENPFLTAVEQPDGTYLATAEIVLADPWAGLENPLGVTGRTSRILVSAVMSDLGRTRVAERTGGTAAYSVSTSETEVSILEISTIASTPAEAIAAFDDVRDELNSELDRRQERAGVPASWRILVSDLAPPQSAVDVSPPVDRATIGILAAGILLALGLSVAVDGVVARRGPSSRPIRRPGRWSAPPRRPRPPDHRGFESRSAAQDATSDADAPPAAPVADEPTPPAERVSNRR